ncbi:hypothetical protein [Sphingomonas humi]|uniref:Uncharacterized protein n=1 Tax=Sphingomonas humi TaxID=335630 RepID=A0ABP7SBY6_9SPHN
MDKERLSPSEPPHKPRLSLAEEQRLAFEEDQKRGVRPGTTRFLEFLFRN